MHVVIPFYNMDEATISNAIQSARQQEYPNDRLTIWVYDNALDSVGAEEILNNACIQFGASNVFDLPISEDDSWVHAYKVLSGLGLRKTHMPPLLCFRSTKHLGPGGSKYW